MILVSVNDRFDPRARTWRGAADAWVESLPPTLRQKTLLRDLPSIESLESTMREIRAAGQRIGEWHVFAPAGVYGFYLGERSFPEQLGQSAWLRLDPPFAEGARVVLHGPFGARWLAPFLAREFGVSCSGHIDEILRMAPQVFEPGLSPQGDPSYNSSANLYDAAFEDITVRAIEWRFVVSSLKRISEEMSSVPRVLDIGCGNGQLLIQLLERRAIGSGAGVDTAEGMIQHAVLRAGAREALNFSHLDRPRLPYPDNSFDAALSFMSFRYLDWNEIVPEIRRVVRPKGFFIMVDMAASRLRFWERPAYWLTKLRTWALHRRRPEFAASLRRLVNDPGWVAMLRYHPMRLASEYELFLRSRFPQGDWRRLYTCYNHKIFGFKSVIQ